MKHTLCIKWLAVGLAALSFGRPADVATNDPNAAYKINLERAISLINTGKTSWASDLSTEAVLCINALEKSGDRSLLPYLAEKSLNASNPKTVRRRAAAAYVNMANVDESVCFLRRLYRTSGLTGWHKETLNKQLIGKLDSMTDKQSREAAQKDVSLFLLEQLQTIADSGIAAQIDQFMLRKLPEYSNSIQRAAIGKKYANTGNEWVTNTFHPIKAHFDNIPPKQRTDLRDRFPDLPPLTEDKNAGGGNRVKVAIAVAVGFIAVVAAWFAVRRKKARKTT